MTLKIKPFYEEIENVVIKLGGRKDRATIVMGAFNSMVGETEVDGILGAFSFGQRNHKGQFLIDYCKEEKFTIRSTQYHTAKKRRFTWKHASGNNMSLIDYMLMNAKLVNLHASVGQLLGQTVEQIIIWLFVH